MIHNNLEVWKKAIELVVKVYKETEKFPTEEKFGLINQMRRAAVSIPSNLAEGSARSSHNELRQFLYISLGSLSELETQIIICQKLGYLQSISYREMMNEIQHIRKMFTTLIRVISNR